MAKVRLLLSEAAGERLPAFCIVCGKPATDRVHHRFVWHPGPRTPSVLGVLFASAQRRRAMVAVPLCRARRWHFRWKTLVPPVCMGLMFLYGIIGLIVSQRFHGLDHEKAHRFLGETCGLSILGWLGVIFLLAMLGVRPVEITDQEIELAGVSDTFERAVKTTRRAADHVPLAEPVLPAIDEQPDSDNPFRGLKS